MSWAAGRRTTRAEHVAYSLFGLLGVTMSPQYGEGGEGAFMRLQGGLLVTTEDELLFAWRMPAPYAGDEYEIEGSPDAGWRSGEWGLFAPSPGWFRGCGRVTIEAPGGGGKVIQRPARACNMSRQGIVIPIMPSPHFNKYKLIMLLSPLLLVGAIAVWIYDMFKESPDDKSRRKNKNSFFYVARKARRAEGGVRFTLNCWPSGTGGQGVGEKREGAAVSIYLTMLPTNSYVGDQEHKFKRTRCEEVELVDRYATRRWEGEGVALQPEVRFGS